jgi:hypothetical protein
MSRDVMRVLTQARPAELDPDAPVDPATLADELHRAMAARPAGRAAAVRRLVPARRRIRPVMGGGLGLVGVAAAAALVITSAGGGQGGITPGQSGGNGTKALDVTSVRAVLLAAADKAEQAPATGKYWRVTQLYLVSVQVGPKARPYTVERATLNEEWIARNGTTWAGQRNAGAKPKTPQDEKAWRADGSPARWDRGINDTPQGGRLYLETKPDAGQVEKVPGGPVLHVPIAGPDPSFADLEKLPTDPAALRKLAERRALSDGDADGLRAANARVRQSYVAGKLIHLLTTAPVPPKVRAAAFRALADVSPVVVSEGKAVDARGRRGVAFRMTVSYGGRGTATTRLIIDPATSQVLSEHASSQIKGGRGAPAKERVTLYLNAGWTNETPRTLALP